MTNIRTSPPDECIAELRKEILGHLNRPTAIDCLEDVLSRTGIIFGLLHDDDPTTPDQAIRGDALTDLLQVADARDVPFDTTLQRALCTWADERWDWGLDDD